LIFQSNSGTEHINTTTGDVKRIYNYTSCFNEKATTDPTIQLLHKALQTVESQLHFESELEIDEIFVKMFNIPDSEVLSSEDDEYDNLNFNPEEEDCGEEDV